jgi:hypothetical protein
MVSAFNAGMFILKKVEVRKYSVAGSMDNEQDHDLF